MSVPRNQRPGCFLTVFCLAVLCGVGVFTASVSAVPRGLTDSIHQIVPRQVQVAVAEDHVWASVRVSIRPHDLGLPSWRRWDVDGNGVLVKEERVPFAEYLRDRETEYLSLMVDGLAVPVSEARWRFEGADSASLPIEAAATLRFEIRTNMEMGPGEHRFVLYDLPVALDGIVPIRFSLSRGLHLGAVQGARAEKRSERRLEAVVSRASPAVWGSFVREAASHHSERTGR